MPPGGLGKMWLWTYASRKTWKDVVVDLCLQENLE
jgi:hypothetical protein